MIDLQTCMVVNEGYLQDGVRAVGVAQTVIYPNVPIGIYSSLIYVHMMSSGRSARGSSRLR